MPKGIDDNGKTVVPLYHRAHVRNRPLSFLISISRAPSPKYAANTPFQAQISFSTGDERIFVLFEDGQKSITTLLGNPTDISQRAIFDFPGKSCNVHCTNITCDFIYNITYDIGCRRYVVPVVDETASGGEQHSLYSSDDEGKEPKKL